MPAQSKRGGPRDSTEKNKRFAQQQRVEAATGRLQEQVTATTNQLAKQRRFASHLSGFYEEVDKLAKGKTLVEATDLIVEHANNIVHEAKVLIEGDVYLDQIKEFVPAGNNPVYPDILWAARAVQQALERRMAELGTLEKQLNVKVRVGKTILAALRFYLGNDSYTATKADVATMVDNPPDEWFHGNYGSEKFDFTRLDNRDIDAYLIEGLTTAR